jgi:MFS family permease
VLRVVTARRRPVATPAAWRPARAPRRGRAPARAIPSGPSETDPSTGAGGEADARVRGDAPSEGTSSDATSSESSSEASSPSLTDKQTDEKPEVQPQPFDWNSVGPGLAPSVATACLGAFLFGYHSAVINAPLSAIADDLGFAGDNAAKGAVVSVLVAGGFLGGLGIGPLADSQGRRAALFATTVPLTIGTLISASADGFVSMTVGRLITGVGVGASSQIVPLYLSEVSPPNLRGTVNGIRRVAYVMGCLLAFQAAVPLQKVEGTGNSVDLEPPAAEAAAPKNTNVAAAKEKQISAKENGAEKAEPAKIAAFAAAKPATAPDVRVAEPPAGATPEEKAASNSTPRSDADKKTESLPSVRNSDRISSAEPGGVATEPPLVPGVSQKEPAPVTSTLPSVSNWSREKNDGENALSPPGSSKTVTDFLRTFGTDAASPAMAPATKDPAPTAPPPLPSPLEYPSGELQTKNAPAPQGAASQNAVETPAEAPGTARKNQIDQNANADSNATEKTPVEKAEVSTSADPARIKKKQDVLAATSSVPPPLTGSEKAEKEKDAAKPRVAAAAPSAAADPSARPDGVSGVDAQNASARSSAVVSEPTRAVVSSTEKKPTTTVPKLPPVETLSSKAEARLETKPVRLAPAEGAKKVAKEKENGDLKKKTSKKPRQDPNAPPRAAAGWWRPLFYWAAAPALLLALSTAGGVAVESPVWLLGPEGCAMESRRSLAKLLNIRGRAAVRWQESVSGAVGRIAVGKARAGRVVRSGDSGDEGDDDAFADAFEDKKTGRRLVKAQSSESDEDEETIECVSTGEPAAQSWSVLFEDRNRQPVIIGLGLCFLAAFSGSNTVIYFASSVLQEAGLTDPGLLTTAVGVPNLLGGLVALVATDAYGRRPLLLLSFGGMSASLAALAIASALTPGTATESFCALPITSPPGEFSGLPCVTCDALAAICDDLPTPDYDGGFLKTFEPQRTVALIAIPAYTLLFSLGAGPVPWLLYNEVFPTRIRARATAVCTAINYASNTIVGASFLPLVNGIGLGGTYGFYALSCFAGYAFVDRFVFETKGLKLEDVEGVMAEREKKWRSDETVAKQKRD